MESEAKDKADQLFYDFYNCHHDMDTTNTRICVMLHINGVISELISQKAFERLEFWNEVKKEIIKL